jgi:hypothetical protein
MKVTARLFKKNRDGDETCIGVIQRFGPEGDYCYRFVPRIQGRRTLDRLYKSERACVPQWALDMTDTVEDVA